MSAKSKERRLERQEELVTMRKAATSGPDAGDTPHARLLRLARTGRFEVLVAQARPAQPARMVTPEEREKALREAGQWPAEKAALAPEAAAEETPAPEPTRELTPNEAYIAEHCRWVPLAERRHRPRIEYGRCLTEYDPFTGELIGDGYRRYGDDDE